MSELFDSLNFPQHRSFASASSHGFALANMPVASPRRLHGTERRHVAEAAVKAAAAVDTWHRHSGVGSNSSSANAKQEQMTKRRPFSSTPLRADRDPDDLLFTTSSQEAGPSSPPMNRLEGRVFWNAAPSPSLQMQVRSLAATSKSKPLDSQAFREELLRAPLSRSGNDFQEKSGSRSETNDNISNAGRGGSGRLSEDRQRYPPTRRRGARRSMRRSATSASSLIDPNSANGLEQLLHDLTDHLDELGHDHNLHGQSEVADLAFDDAQQSQIDSALLESMAQSSSQDVPTELVDVTNLKRSQTWARTVSMPTHSPSSKAIGSERAGDNHLADEGLETSILGKRQLPRSPLHGEASTDSQQENLMASPSHRPTTRRFQRVCSEGIRPVMIENPAFETCSPSQALKEGSPPKKPRNSTLAGASRGAAPRVGLSKSTWSAPAATSIGSLAAANKGAGSTRVGKALHSQFKPPLRRSPRKAPVAGPKSNETMINQASDNTLSRTALFDKAKRQQNASTIVEPQKGISSRTSSMAVSSQIARDRTTTETSTSAPSTKTEDVAEVGDASFDTSMTSVDESALCEVADLVEASQSIHSARPTQSSKQSAKKSGSARAAVHAPETITMSQSVDPASDDSLDMALSGEVDDAVLASMDAQGW